MTTKTPWDVDKMGIMRDEYGEYLGDLWEAAVPRELWPQITSAVNSHETAKKLADTVLKRHIIDNIEAAPCACPACALARQFKKEAENG